MSENKIDEFPVTGYIASTQYIFVMYLFNE